ncbi:MAG: hypothetical protein ACYS47_10590, partial [Planctomycetota bacterium]
MIFPAKPNHWKPNGSGALILFCAVVLLPLSLAYAQEPDYEAVGERLIRAVQAGELSPEQASAMMGELARARFSQKLHEACRNRGDRGDGGMEGNFRERGVSGEGYDAILEALRRGGIRGGGKPRQSWA